MPSRVWEKLQSAIIGNKTFDTLPPPILLNDIFIPFPLLAYRFFYKKFMSMPNQWRWIIVLIHITQITKNISLFLSNTNKWLEIKLWMPSFISLAAQKWIILAIHFQTSQSVQKALFTCVVYMYTNCFNWYLLIHLQWDNVAKKDDFNSFDYNIFESKSYPSCLEVNIIGYLKFE